MPVVVIAPAYSTVAPAMSIEKEQPAKLAELRSQWSGSTTCSCAGDSDSSPCVIATSHLAATYSDEETLASPYEETISPSVKESRFWSKSTTCSSEDGAESTPSGEEAEEEVEREEEDGADQCERGLHANSPSTTKEEDDAIARKLALMGQSGIVSALGRILSHLASMGCKPQRPTMFHARTPPPISIEDYLARLAEYYNCSDACLVLALVYIDRAVKYQPQLVIGPLNVHRMLAVALMLAAKFHDDVYYSNSYYGKVAGMSVTEMNRLEETFLKMLRWKLLVQPVEYEMIVDHVLRAAGMPTS
mmetsp:Transcript_27799/g.80607  ORF Transcript_27799/g.80607 Transcript_27799/m.80607 type:complete len:304 (-) Transcript_27799:632-1543(-)